MDERGEAWDTGRLREEIDRWEMAGTGRVAVLIGGAGGHPEAVRAGCDVVLALSAMTLQHELALVVVLEQVYRVYTMKRGEPYHR